MALFEQISKDIMSAMKAHDKVRLEALRNIKKNFIEAKTAPGSNDELTDDAALKILAKMAKQGKRYGCFVPRAKPSRSRRRGGGTGKGHRDIFTKATIRRRSRERGKIHYCRRWSNFNARYG